MLLQIRVPWPWLTVDKNLMSMLTVQFVSLCQTRAFRETVW